jgi:hypothetical protein
LPTGKCAPTPGAAVHFNVVLLGKVAVARKRIGSSSYKAIQAAFVYQFCLICYFFHLQRRPSRLSFGLSVDLNSIVDKEVILVGKKQQNAHMSANARFPPQDFHPYWSCWLCDHRTHMQEKGIFR